MGSDNQMLNKEVRGSITSDKLVYFQDGLRMISWSVLAFSFKLFCDASLYCFS